MLSLTLTAYSLTVEGLLILYESGCQKHSLQYDPLAACDLLKDAGFIEDFTLDKNSEPVILFTDSSEPQGYGYELWCRFVSSFLLTQRTAELIVEHKESARVYHRNMDKIDSLLLLSA